MEVHIVIGDPKSKKTYQKDVEENPFIGKEIGEKVSLDAIGLEGYEGIITGGSYETGHPMKPGLKTQGLVSQLFEPYSFNNWFESRRRKKVAGAIISNKTSQINIKIVKEGNKPISEIIPPRKKK
ncbi:MAG: eS6 family ribosomal protein [Candidatus Parvarchaeota archaeon]|nr:eS6 family ribosomal protein [Candidatus Rehaiarchaeum fermentans]